MNKIKVLIVEDEIPAQVVLERLIYSVTTDLEVVGKCTSVQGTLDWLSCNEADLIFMDIELSDGISFEIFSKMELNAPIIFTTAYSDYALKAFKVNGIDYLMKPIGRDDFEEAMRKFRRLQVLPQTPSSVRSPILLEEKSYRQRFTAKIGDKIIIINTSEIAYFYAEDKATYVMISNGKSYILDYTLDGIEELVDSKQFFRISRNCLSTVRAISGVTKHFNGRLKINLLPVIRQEVMVSRQRTQPFMEWLEG